MAKTIARAIGYDNGRRKETHRLGSVSSFAEAATWRTFAQAEVKADGSGFIRVVRDGQTMFGWDFGPESEKLGAFDIPPDGDRPVMVS
jgi:hypothetical protein